MKKELTRFRWTGSWMSEMGCILPGLKHLGIDVSRAWAYGATGYAFALNVHDSACPSGPTAWANNAWFPLAPSLGVRMSEINVMGTDPPEFAAAQEEAWSFTRNFIDRNLPCYGWELKIPEYYTLHGYDETGYYFSGPCCDHEEGPKPWQDLGRTEIGWLNVRGMEPCEPSSPEEAVKGALAFALELSKSPSRLIWPGYRSGPEAYERWADALERGECGAMGQAYNAKVWSECRTEAPEFLREAKAKLPGRADDALEEAITHYTEVAEALQAHADLFPFDPQLSGNTKSDEGAKQLRQAARAEAAGLAVLERTLNDLQLAIAA